MSNIDRRHSLLIGQAAREETVKAKLKKYRVLHFARHGILNDQSPLCSYLLLSTDGNSNEDGLLESLGDHGNGSLRGWQFYHSATAQEVALVLVKG